MPFCSVSVDPLTLNSLRAKCSVVTAALVDLVLTADQDQVDVIPSRGTRRSTARARRARRVPQSRARPERSRTGIPLLPCDVAPGHYGVIPSVYPEPSTFFVSRMPFRDALPALRTRLRSEGSAVPSLALRKSSKKPSAISTAPQTP